MTVADVAACSSSTSNDPQLGSGTLPGSVVLRSDLDPVIDEGYHKTAQDTTTGPPPAAVWDGQTPSHPEPGSSSPVC
jgi:hypothetical protein